jgi:hypothetical protein
MTQEYFIISELYVAGMTEDGEDYIAERFALMSNSFGRDYQVSPFFNGCRVEQDHETGMTFFIDIRKDAIAQAEAYTAR